MAKHMAVTKDGAGLVVSYMLLPQTADQALVTRIDSLPNHIQRTLLSLVESPEAQNSRDLADVLGRRTYADSGKTMLHMLHEMKRLETVSIDEVYMVPKSGVRFPLRQVLEQMGRIPSAQAKEQGETQGFNPHVNNQVASATEEEVGMAKSLLIEAEMLEADAAAKRAKAYNMVPHLRPVPEDPSVPEIQPLVEADSSTEETSKETDANTTKPKD